MEVIHSPDHPVTPNIQSKSQQEWRKVIVFFFKLHIIG